MSAEDRNSSKTSCLHRHRHSSRKQIHTSGADPGVGAGARLHTGTQICYKQGGLLPEVEVLGQRTGHLKEHPSNRADGAIDILYSSVDWENLSIKRKQKIRLYTVTGNTEYRKQYCVQCV